MAALSPSFRLLAQEARALLSRLNAIKPFALQMTSVLAAALQPDAQTAIETCLERGRRHLRRMVVQYLQWLHSAAGADASPAQAQRRFTIVRLRFNAMLSQFDIFSDVLVQRSEHENGVWISGLDVVAADALKLPGYYEAPPVVCYLDRGHGAAIRRARTRLPGGEESPVAIIRVPRERMVGSGIASSLIHEVGHQANALLDLINSLRPTLLRRRGRVIREKAAWQMWEHCLSEILSDFWSVAKVGITSTMGLIGVVSLPRAFVFRIDLHDPHPAPWIRVKLSCAMGRRLYPHSQWDELEAIWDAFYPVEGLDPEGRQLLDLLGGTIPEFVDIIAKHRPEALRGASLAEILAAPERQPASLTRLYQDWQRVPRAMRQAAPSLVFAVIGQARAEEKISPEAESRLLGELLAHWALRATLDMSALCANQPLRSRALDLPLPAERARGIGGRVDAALRQF